MSTEKMREEFELSFTKRSKARGEVARLDKFDDGRYEYLDTSAAWWAWKESRAAIEVDLPPEWAPVSERDDGANEMREHCASAIESLGLKVKP